MSVVLCCGIIFVLGFGFMAFGGALKQGCGTAMSFLAGFVVLAFVFVLLLVAMYGMGFREFCGWWPLDGFCSLLANYWPQEFSLVGVWFI